MINKWIGIGNVGRDPEVRVTKGGTSVANFSVATNKKVKGEDRTTWVNIVCWGKTAENVDKYVTKGKQVYIEGELQNSSWEGDDGVKHYKTEVNAWVVMCLGRKGEGREPDVPVDTYEIGDLGPPLDMDDTPLTPGD